VSPLWERRRRRAEALARRWPEAAEVLRFYDLVLRLQERGESDPDAYLRLARAEGPPELPERGSFLLDALARQPALVRAAAAWDGPRASAAVPARCPHCSAPPAAGVLRDDPEAQALRRLLVCSDCALEWEFPRVVCPACGEEKPEQLPRFTEGGTPWIRIDACESCRAYVKSVDLSKEPAADPYVDELASMALDLAARSRGYAKLHPNLAGL
jgi:FdhE protein